MKIRNICFALLAMTLVSCGNNENNNDDKDVKLNKEEFVKELSNLEEPADSKIYQINGTLKDGTLVYKSTLNDKFNFEGTLNANINTKEKSKYSIDLNAHLVDSSGTNEAYDFKFSLKTKDEANYTMSVEALEQAENSDIAITDAEKSVDDILKTLNYGYVTKENLMSLIDDSLTTDLEFRKEDNKLELGFSYTSKNSYLGDNAEIKLENSKVIFENTGKLVSFSGLISANNIDLSKLNNSGDNAAATGTVDLSANLTLTF